MLQRWFLLRALERLAPVSVSIHLVTTDAHHFSPYIAVNLESTDFSLIQEQCGRSDTAWAPTQSYCRVQYCSVYCIMEEHDPHCHFKAKSHQLWQSCVCKLAAVTFNIMNRSPLEPKFFCIFMSIICVYKSWYTGPQYCIDFVLKVLQWCSKLK